MGSSAARTYHSSEIWDLGWNFAASRFLALILGLQIFREVSIISWEPYKHCTCFCCSEKLDTRLLGHGSGDLSFCWSYFLGSEWNFSLRDSHLHGLYHGLCRVLALWSYIVYKICTSYPLWFFSSCSKKKRKGKILSMPNFVASC